MFRAFKRLRTWWRDTRPSTAEERFGTMETVSREIECYYREDAKGVNIDGTER